MKQIASLADTPHTLMDHAEGHVVIASAGGLVQFTDDALQVVDAGVTHSATRGPDGSYYCTRSSRVLRFDIEANRGPAPDAM
ncbi:MAG: hypothetical protein HOC05_23390, partial [Gemmatimonadetes bacterium]|nr:hypothetical protein [Gemmatimonadota bacterium]